MRDKGFWAVLIGGSIGAFVGLWPGAFVGIQLVDLLNASTEGLEDLVWALMGAGVGGWFGGVAGAYLLMRWSGVGRRGATTFWLAVLVPLMVGSGTWVAVSRTDSDDFGSNWLPYTIFGLSVVATAYLSRFLGTRGPSLRERSQI